MSPARFNQEPKMINGPRPAPLNINKESHLINKPTKTTASFVAPQYVSKPPPPPQRQQQQQQRTQPVIIYTHSPKVIHTQARDFMALVQKLTGLSRSNSINNQESKQPSKSKAASAVNNDDNESSSVVTEENFRGNGGDHGGDDGGIGSAVVDHFKTETLNPPHNSSSSNNNHPYLADIPLFTPTGTDFFCSPRLLYRYNESSSIASPGIGNLSSPSVFEFLKGLPEY